MPERRLIDTSVLSLFLKRDTRAVAYLPHLVGTIGIISFITLAELYRWPEERRSGTARHTDLIHLLAHYAVVYPAPNRNALDIRCLSQIPGLRRPHCICKYHL